MMGGVSKTIVEWAICRGTSTTLSKGLPSYVGRKQWNKANNREMN